MLSKSALSEVSRAHFVVQMNLNAFVWASAWLTHFLMSALIWIILKEPKISYFKEKRENIFKTGSLDINLYEEFLGSGS